MHSQPSGPRPLHRDVQKHHTCMEDTPKTTPSSSPSSENCMDSIRWNHCRIRAWRGSGAQRTITRQLRRACGPTIKNLESQKQIKHSYNYAVYLIVLWSQTPMRSSDRSLTIDQSLIYGALKEHLSRAFHTHLVTSSYCFYSMPQGKPAILSSPCQHKACSRRLPFQRWNQGLALVRRRDWIFGFPRSFCARR